MPRSARRNAKAYQISPVEEGKRIIDLAMKKIGHLNISELENTYFENVYPDCLTKILEYLPTEFSDESEEKYLDSLLLATETSFMNRLYQFAYVQYHMLFMTSVYYMLLKAYYLHEEELQKGLYYLLKDRYSDFWSESNTKGGRLYFGSFAIISENDVFMLLHTVGINSDLLGELQKLVRKRNKYAHANGQLQLTSDELFIEAIDNYNGQIQHVIDLLKDDMICFYKKIICDPNFYDPEIRAYLDPDEQIIQEFIKEYSLSRAELNWLRKIRLSDFAGLEGEHEIKTLHSALIHYYRELTQDDYQLFDDPYVLFKYKNNAEELIERELEISPVECAKDGGEFPLYDCLNCGEHQLVYDANAHRYHCFACDQNYTDEELSFCEHCGSIMLRNDTVDICPACIDAIGAE